MSRIESVHIEYAPLGKPKHWSDRSKASAVIRVIRETVERGLVNYRYVGTKTKVPNELSSAIERVYSVARINWDTRFEARKALQCDATIYQIDNETK